MCEALGSGDPSLPPMPLVLCLIGRTESSLEFCRHGELAGLELEKVQSVRPRKLGVSLAGVDVQE